MPDIKPFCGLLYNTSRVDIAEVVAPPYDVITNLQQQELYECSPYNVVRLVLNRDKDPYISAAKYLNEWRKTQIVISDSEPAIYVLSQTFTLSDGAQVDRKGFIAACRLEEFGKGSVYPHEKTHSGPKEDRFRLFQSTNSMFSQIFSLYSDPESALDVHLNMVMANHPSLDVTFEGVRNRLWKLTNERTILAIADELRSQRAFIADGHHRYETALAFRDAKRLQNPHHSGKESYNFVPMFFTNMHDPGLVILPTHRLLHSKPGFQPQKFLKALHQFFHVEGCSSLPQLMTLLSQCPRHSFGLILSTESHYSLLRLIDRSPNTKQSRVPEIVRQLDVSVLHDIIFKQVLGMSEEEQAKKLFIDYEKDSFRAAKAVEEGRAQAAFLMNPTPIEQVRSVAVAGFVMPQKSTYFYPKLLSGLVMYSFA